LIDWNPEYLYKKLIPDDSARAEFLNTICTRGWNFEQDAGRSWADAVSERIAKFPNHADLIRAYDTRWPEMVSGVLQDVVDIKDELRASGIPVYAITNFSDEKWAVAQQLFPTLAEFDGIVVSGAEKMMKPDNRIYALLCSRYGLNAADCIFIDDLIHNIKGAENAGMQGHVFTNAANLRDTLREFLGTL
jgi:HAD superfamily hydrolase (TIGR01509 family)